MQLRRNRFFESLDGEQLVAAVGLVASPGSIGEQIEFGQSPARVAERVAIETRHGVMDSVEPPTGQTVSIGGQCEKQIQADVLGPQAVEQSFASEAMVDPSERRGDFSDSLRRQQWQGFFQWHDVFSVKSF